MLHFYLYLIEKGNASFVLVSSFYVFSVSLTSWNFFLIILRASHLFPFVTLALIKMASVNWTAGKLPDWRAKNGFLFCTRYSATENLFFLSLDKLWFYHELNSLESIFGAIKHSLHAIPLEFIIIRTNVTDNKQSFLLSSYVSIPFTCSEINLNSKEWKIRNKLQWP